MVPVVQIMEQVVQNGPLLKTLALRHHRVVGFEETFGEPPKHSHDGQVELVVSVEGGRVKYAAVSATFPAVARPQVTVQQTGPHLQTVRKHPVHFAAVHEFGPQVSSGVVRRHFDLREDALIGVELLPVVVPAVVQ